MKVIRTTIVTPRPGAAGDVDSLLKELGQYLSKEPGFIEAYAFKDDGKLGRVSVWESREDADRSANQVHTIALRARIYALTLPDRQERLAEINGELHATPAVAA